MATPYSGIPLPGTPVPAPVLAAAADRSIHPVWVNELGGLTYRLGDGPGALFAKWAPAGSGFDLPGEAARMAWAGMFAAVPRVVEHGEDADGSWLVTAALPGEMAVVDRWKADPVTAVRVIGEGLRIFHDALPVAGCPFSWSAEERVAEAHANPERIKARGFHPDYAHLTPETALRRLTDIPPADKLVVCHGDTCPPNTLIGPDGRFAGHVDLGALGVADRWADLAVATWGTTWNYGAGWERPLLDAYGVDPDPERIDYYRLLWEVGP
jgi:kanamycin kinase